MSIRELFQSVENIQTGDVIIARTSHTTTRYTITSVKRLPSQECYEILSQPYHRWCLRGQDTLLIEYVLNATTHQAGYDHYNTSYNNQTYRDFGEALQRHVANDEEYYALMNMLTDAALERAGALTWNRYEAAFFMRLDGVTSELRPLAETHLNNFGSAVPVENQTITLLATASTAIRFPQPDLPLESQVKLLLEHARDAAQEAGSTASGVHSTHGVIAYHLCHAAAYALFTAYILLDPTQEASYWREKLGSSVHNLKMAAEYLMSLDGTTISPEFVRALETAWTKRSH